MTSHQNDLHKILARLLVQEVFDTESPTYRSPAMPSNHQGSSIAAFIHAFLFLIPDLQNYVRKTNGSHIFRLGECAGWILEWANDESGLHFALSGTFSCALGLSEGLKNLDETGFYVSSDILMLGNEPRLPIRACLYSTDIVKYLAILQKFQDRPVFVLSCMASMVIPLTEGLVLGL